jgi:hypothetical protein
MVGGGSYIWILYIYIAASKPKWFLSNWVVALCMPCFSRVYHHPPHRFRSDSAMPFFVKPQRLLVSVLRLCPQLSLRVSVDPCLIDPPHHKIGNLKFYRLASNSIPLQPSQYQRMVTRPLFDHPPNNWHRVCATTQNINDKHVGWGVAFMSPFDCRKDLILSSNFFRASSAAFFLSPWHFVQAQE